MAAARYAAACPSVLFAVSVLAAACASTPQVVDEPSQPSSATGYQFFRSAGSPWTTPVPDDAPVEPSSAAYVQGFSGLEPVISVRRFSVPVFVAHENTPTYTVSPTAEYSMPGYTVENIRIPDRAEPDPDDDGHMAVLDATTQCVVEFYRARRDGAGWTAEWINSTPADGNGIYPDGLSTRASGFSSAAGLIWPDELRDGWIPHALVFAYPNTRDDMIVGPATRTDGWSAAADALPMGAHLRLDPTLDLDSLDLSPSERTIATALQQFGMVLADTGGGLTLYAAHPESFAADPYPPLLGNVDYADISGIPFDRMQVLSLGQPKERYDGPPIANRCNADSIE
jgi:hypothetical protein